MPKKLIDHGVMILAFSVNDAHRACFTQFSTRIYWNKRLAASDIFAMFTQSINFYTFHCHMLKITDVWIM